MTVLVVLIAKYPHKNSFLRLSNLGYTRATEFVLECPMRLGFTLVVKRKIIVNKLR
jgi:hypothetical protein